jgi:23S rRNA pseudouridine1911/1915/1917 synthase
MTYAARGKQLRRPVTRDAAGMRLDAWVAREFPDLGRNRAKRLVQDGQVAIDGQAVVEVKRTVRAGEQVSVVLPPPEPAAPKGQRIHLDIVYEDEALIVIDKPAGLVVHPAAGNQTGTLVNALIAHCGQSLSGIGGVARPGIVHRLDKDTSGLIVAAKTDRAHKRLAAQFADHGLTGALVRAYLAIVWGAPPRPFGTIDASLGRSTRNREKIAVKPEDGRRAITHYRVVARYRDDAVASLINCQLETGRTHQIRVHMASLGHPLIGDRTYGSGFVTKAALLPEPARSIVAGFPRQALHAYLLGFEHPVTGEAMRFERPLPADMAALAEALKAL